MSTEGLVKKWRGQHGKRYLFSNAEEMADALGRLSAENEALRAQVEALTKERDDLHTCLDGAGKGQQMVEAELNKYAHALVDLTEVVCPGLRSGDILADAKTALSKATTPQALTRPAVPEFSRIAQRKLDEKLEEGFQVNGYAIQRDSTRGFIDSAGFVGWWTPGVHALAIATIDAMERPAVPEGWKPVPVEPTWEMLEAWVDAVAGPDESPIRAGYQAMLNAAPTIKESLTVAPQPSQQEAVREIGVNISGWTEHDALAILNQISDGPFGQDDVDDALAFMRLVDDQRQLKILADVEAATQPTEAVKP